MRAHPPKLHLFVLRLVALPPLLFTLVFLANSAAFGQTSSGPTKVHGFVHDGNGGAVRNAQVQVQSGGGIDFFTTDAAGEFVGQVSVAGSRIRVQATAKGYRIAFVDASVEKESPGCEASLVLAKGRKQVAPPGSLICREPVPSFANFDAALGDQDFSPPSAGNMLFSQSAHYAPGAAKVSTMWIGGAYVFQTSPPTPQPVRIRVAAASILATWTLSNPEVAYLLKINSTVARIDFLHDGDTTLTIVDGGQTLRIRLIAGTIPAEATWQAKVFRVDESGKMIDSEGNITK